MKTPDQIARECLYVANPTSEGPRRIIASNLRQRITDAICAAVAEEREACAKVVESIEPNVEWAYAGKEIGSYSEEESASSCLSRAVEAIRARANDEKVPHS